MVESQPSKLLVAGSIPVSRSNLRSQIRRRLSSVARRAEEDTMRAAVGKLLSRTLTAFAATDGKPMSATECCGRIVRKGW